jgi:hypothetical protein
MWTVDRIQTVARRRPRTGRELTRKGGDASITDLKAESGRERLHAPGRRL